ncbi:MAG: ATPase V [Spirochaetaceae bacterium]|nr:ATPase V [Spirochaetaceae bacterium]MBO5236446.1 ATPase V [Spirochaetaceae bacterium]
MKYFVIGERELVLAFALVGVEGQAVANREEALESFHRVTGYGTSLTSGTITVECPKILILTENVSVMIEDEVLEWQMKGEYPLIVEIPGLQGHLEGKKTLTDSIREAIGIHV